MNDTIIDVYRNSNEYIFMFDEIMHLQERYEFWLKIRSSEKYRKFRICSKCDKQLDTGYVYIIYYLKKADLLPEDFETKCCFCNIFECIGLEIPEEWNSVQVEAYDSFSISREEKERDGISGIRITGYYGDQFFKFHFKIWDTDLTLKTGRITNHSKD